MTPTPSESNSDVSRVVKTLAKPNGRVPVFVEQEAIRKIKRYGSDNRDYEVCGVLLGNLCLDPDDRWRVVVDDIIIGKGARHSQGAVTFTEQTWNYINDQQERLFPHKMIIGWFHTHPGFGIFFSDDDLTVHRMGFTYEWEIAYVYDPVRDDDGWFLWDDAKREPVLSDDVIYVDTRKDASDGLSDFTATARQAASTFSVEDTYVDDYVAVSNVEDKWNEMTKHIIYGGVAVLLFLLVLIGGIVLSLQQRGIKERLDKIEKLSEILNNDLGNKQYKDDFELYIQSNKLITQIANDVEGLKDKGKKLDDFNKSVSESKTVKDLGARLSVVEEKQGDLKNAVDTINVGDIVSNAESKASEAALVAVDDLSEKVDDALKRIGAVEEVNTVKRGLEARKKNREMDNGDEEIKAD